MARDLTGRRAVVIGGTGGIGGAIASALTTAGASLAIADMRKPKSMPEGIGFVSLDVRQAGGVPTTFDAAEAALGAPSISW